MEQRPVPVRVIAKVLGVSGNQVYMWHKRRDTNGFPDEVASTLVPQYPGDKRKTPLFDLDAVVDWWTTYDANKNKGAHNYAGQPRSGQRGAQPW